MSTKPTPAANQLIRWSPSVLPTSMLWKRMGSYELSSFFVISKYTKINNPTLKLGSQRGAPGNLEYKKSSLKKPADQVRCPVFLSYTGTPSQDAGHVPMPTMKSSAGPQGIVSVHWAFVGEAMLLKQIGKTEVGLTHNEANKRAPASGQT